MSVYISEFDWEDWHFVMAAGDNGIIYFENHMSTEYLKKHLERFLPDMKRVTGYEADEFNAGYMDDIMKYFNGELKVFDWTYDLHGTPFQQSVWEALMNIPYGETRSYSEISTMIQNESAVRAVGGAIGVNPIMIVIPCHRIIGKSGSLTGFRGGLPMKRRLLEIESIPYDG